MDLISTVEEGKLKGKIEKDFKGGDFLSFLGVPYAKAPVGNLRFKAPQPPEKWEGVRDATKEGKCSLQVEMTVTKDGSSRKIVGSEDCLFLNIFTRQLFKSDKDLKPVIVYVHGGVFVIGSNSRSFHGPEFLITEDIVLITLNYRLGILGFLKFDNPSLEATGNTALKDIVQALRWIQRNVKHFGGNQHNVTLVGHSAGAALVQFLHLSPLSKGLFHKVIIQSGSVLNPWSRGINSAKKLCKSLGCKETDSAKILEFLQEIPAEEILEFQKNMNDWAHACDKRSFGPYVEPQSANAICAEEPLDVLNSGTYNQMPIMIGYTLDEGMIEVWMENTIFNPNYTSLVPYYFGYSRNSEIYQETNKKISRFYVGREDFQNVDRKFHIDVHTDTMFLGGIYDCLKLYIKTSKCPVYLYRVSIDAKLNVLKASINPNSKGVCHGDELGYLFKTGNTELVPGSTEELAVLRFIKMWANFAKTGRPIPERTPLLNADWKPIVKDEINFLDIGSELVPGINPDIDRLSFWDELKKDVRECY